MRDFRLNRTPLETQIYKQLLEWSSQWMSEALTAPNIVTGKTTAEDIAWGCVFLASDESSFMTGAELVIDGGMTAQ